MHEPRLKQIERQEALRSLVLSGILLAREHSLEQILRKIVETARDLVGARYAALGVIGSEPDSGLVEFVTVGIDVEDRRRIGSLPVGRGILGVLIDDPSPLRLRRLSDDPRSVGFPEHHPPMDSFLGVRVSARGQVFGNIYMAEKIGADEFTDEDEAIAVILAEQAGVAIENARLLEHEKHRATNEIRRAVLKRTIDAQEDERRRLARELHDETGQSLTAIMLALRLLEKTGLQPVAAEQVERLRRQVGDTLREVRRLAVRLRPTALDDIGLAAAIERLVAESLEPAGVAVAIDTTAFPDRVDVAVETVLYRVVQEAVTNIAKHAGASSAEITLATDGRQVSATVVDDGAGFDPAVGAAGVGLIGMRERVEVVGGTLNVTSRAAEGTRVVARVPVLSALDDD